MPEEPAAPATGTEGPAPAPTEPEPATTPEPEPEPEPKPTETVDFWKEKAREQEKRAKANAKAQTELEKLRKQTMSETEKAVAEAEAKGRQSAMAEVGERLAAAKIETALTGIVPNPGDIVEDLNLAKYVTDDGSVDEAAVKALRTKYEGLAPKPDAKPPAGQRPKPALRTVPVAENGGTPMTDMNEVMRARARNA